MEINHIDFKNTKIAFGHKSDRDLQMQYLLFKGMSSGGLVKVGKWASDIAARYNIPIGWALKPTLYRHFVTGETLSSSLPTLRKLHTLDVQGVMDYSAEGGDSADESEENFNKNMEAVLFTADNKELSHAVFKVSGIGKVEILEKANNPDTPLSTAEQDEINRVHDRFMKLCEAAYDRGVPLLVDAEHYAYQDLIDRFTEEAIIRYNRKRVIVFATLQMYRRDRLQYLKRLDRLTQDHKVRIGIKFVRGAYMEEERARAAEMGYSDPICPTKEDTDQNYNIGVVYVMDRLDRFELFMGTHNEVSTYLLISMLAEKGLEPNDPRVYFAQLYGMSDNLTFNLAKSGYNVTKYCPYAPVDKVLPYLIRRAQENTSVKGQSSRELLLIQSELDRRKKAKKK